MDDRKIPIRKQLKDCLIMLDDNHGVRINLIVSDTNAWSLLLGRNF